MSQPEDNAQINQAEETHLRSPALGSNSNQPGKLSQPPLENKLLKESKMLGKQVMILDELLLCRFLMIMSLERS